MFEKLEELAKNNKKISDFHIRSGSPLAYRQTGEIVMVKDVVVKPQDLIDMMTTNCNEHETKKFQDTHELDSAVTISGLRFRANFYKTLNGPAAVLRRVESKIPEMGQFDLPDVLYDIIDMHKGLDFCRRALACTPYVVHRRHGRSLSCVCAAPSSCHWGGV